MNSDCCSVQRTSVIESYVWFRKLWRSALSETHASGNRAVWTTDLSSQAILIPDEKATMEKEWKEATEKAFIKTKNKESPLCCIDGYPSNSKVLRQNNLKCGHKYEHIPVNVRKSNFKCGNYQVQMKELYPNFQRRSMKQKWRSWKFKKIWTIIHEAVDGCRQWNVTRMNSKSSSSISIIIELIRNVLFEFWQVVSCRITVHHCAKKKKTLIICVMNFHSLPWNITSTTHKIRTTVETKMNLQTCIGKIVAFTMRVNPGLLEKQHRQQRQRQQQSYVNTSWGQSLITEKISAFEKTEIWIVIPDVEKILFETSHRHVFLLRQHDKLTAKKREQRFGRLYSQFCERRTCKIPKLIGKRIHVWGLVALPLTAEASDL